MRTREELWARLRELQADLPVIDDFDDVEVFPEEGCKSALHALVREERADERRGCEEIARTRQFEPPPALWLPKEYDDARAFSWCASRIGDEIRARAGEEKP